MQLNQAGRWSEAAVVAERLLSAADSLPLLDRCETRYSLAYAYDMTDRGVQAREQTERILRECAEFRDSWVLREARKLHAGRDQENAQTPTRRTDDGWRTADPLAAGLDTTALSEHLRRCEASGADACLVAYRGQIVQEWYGREYREPMPTMSSVKSWTALLAGILIADGKLGLDDPVSKWIPEWTAGSTAGVTVRHLLTMTSGLPDDPPDEPDVGSTGHKNAFAFGRSLASAPGTGWAYSNDGAQLLSPILERAAGEPLADYARRRLFTPLRMRDTELRIDESGAAWTYADAQTTLRDFAKICQASLDGGRSLTGEQVVPQSWISTITTPIAQNPRYGMLWWSDGGGEVVATRGYLNTDCLAIRSLDLVIARMQSRPRERVQSYYGPDYSALILRIVPRR